MSGKTTELLRRAERYILQKRKVLMVKYANDTRYSVDCITTHKGTQMVAVPVTSMTDLLDRFSAQLQEADVVCVDEGQFIQDLEMCDNIVSCMGKVCIVAGLDADFQRRPFQEMMKLIPLAEQITKLTSVCSYCFGDGSFSYRID